MKNTKKILSISIALSIILASVQISSQNVSLSLGITLTPEREAELLGKSKAYVESMTEADKLECKQELIL